MAYDGSKPANGSNLVSSEIRENFRALKEDGMIFGEQLLFDGAPDDIVAVRLNNYSRISYGYLTKEKLDALSVMDLKAIPIVAMRRIIKEPKRWTWEDKKAGRLPEVGAKCNHCHSVDERTVLSVTDKYVGIECDNSDIKPYFVTHAEFIQYYIPIETPAEKAQRLEDEFVKSEMKDTTLSIEWACIYERGIS